MPQARPKPIILMILDGWGVAHHSKGNAIKLANTPHMDALIHTYPNTTLQAAGQAVGLPQGEDGNTLTGHLNIGAGQIVYQDLPRINKSIADGSFQSNKAFNDAIDHVRKNQSTLHLLGLVGSGGVHSNLEHLYALLNLAKIHRIQRVSIHVITDGRDSPPTSGFNYIRQLQDHCQQIGIGKIATIMGRYYAMDRDNHWDRTQVAYDALTQAKGSTATDPLRAVQEAYQNDITDEFIKPIIITNTSGKPISTVRANDAVIFFNFRIDRPRQLTKAFVLPNIQYIDAQKEGFDPHAIKYYKSHLAEKPKPQSTFHRGKATDNLLFITMTQYEKGLPVTIAFPPQRIDMPLARVVAEQGLRQLRITETEKERFVTYYMSGQREDPFPGEDRIIIPSPPIATYDKKPEMSSHELTQTILERIAADQYDLIIVNFPNADMVAHTGNLNATIKACEILDRCIRQVTDAVLAKRGAMLITADHGNAEEVINLTTGDVDTEHSTFPVPCIIIANHLKHKFHQLPQGILADVAPTVLSLMNIPIPSSMSGRSLLP